MTALSRARRVIAVTVGLAAAGALTGAVCGVLALLPLIISHWLRSTPDIHFTRGVLLVLMGARAGAILGAVLGPTVAWGLLRRAPLWRVITWAAAGTGLVASGPAVGLGALAGMVAGGVALRLRVQRPPRAVHPEAAT